MQAVMTHQWKVVRLCNPCWQVNEQKRADGAKKSAAAKQASVGVVTVPVNQPIGGQPTPNNPSVPPQTYAQQPQQAPIQQPQHQGPPPGQPGIISPAQPPVQVQGQVIMDPVAGIARVVPPIELMDGPPVPANPGDLPPFPGKNAIESGNLFGMLGMALSMAATATAHQRDPHLSNEENGVRLADKIGNISGHNQQISTLQQAVEILQQHHLPQGITAGFVVTDPPQKGTLGAQYGLCPYDFIYGWESVLCTPDTTPKMLANDMKGAFLTKGFFTLLIYNFAQRRYRRVNVAMPPGKPTAILGIATAQIPLNSSQLSGVAEPSDDIYVKAWRKRGSMYISAGSNAVPLYAPLTSENQDLYVKVSRKRGGMWISTGEYHPIYDYVQLSEPLFAEAWRYRNGMLIRSNSEYAQLPMERVSVAQPSTMPMQPQPYPPGDPVPSAAPSYAQQPQQMPLQNQPYYQPAPIPMQQPAPYQQPMPQGQQEYYQQQPIQQQPMQQQPSQPFVPEQQSYSAPPSQPAPSQDNPYAQMQLQAQYNASSASEMNVPTEIPAETPQTPSSSAPSDLEHPSTAVQPSEQTSIQSLEIISQADTPVAADEPHHHDHEVGAGAGEAHADTEHIEKQD